MLKWILIAVLLGSIAYLIYLVGNYRFRLALIPMVCAVVIHAVLSSIYWGWDAIAGGVFAILILANAVLVYVAVLRTSGQLSKSVVIRIPRSIAYSLIKRGIEHDPRSRYAPELARHLIQTKILEEAPDQELKLGWSWKGAEMELKHEFRELTPEITEIIISLSWKGISKDDAQLTMLHRMGLIFALERAYLAGRELESREHMDPS